MQCPFCLCAGLEGDRHCYKCGRPFRPGISQYGLMNLMGLLFAGTMAAALIFTAKASHYTGPDAWAGYVTSGLFVAGAGLVGSVVGWVIGAVVCER